MNILITGGTGFIGKQLVKKLIENNHTLCVLTRNLTKAHQCLLNDQIRYITHLEEIQSDDIFDAVINLAGAPIAKRWTQTYKNEIKESRINLTLALVSTLKKLKQKPKVLISGSAIGYYGPHGDEALSEEALPEVNSFSHELCKAWENAANQAQGLGIRVCCVRTGIVLGKQGGALQKMRLPLWLGVGGQIGDGNQWMSWIHIEDMIAVILFCLENNEIEGAVNATSPNPVTNKEFTQTYAKVLHRPAFFKTPGLVLQLVFGQMATELLIQGQKVIPQKLLQHHFSFQFPDLQSALNTIEGT